MGLPMYVSPSPSKRQLPSKQPTSPPYTPQNEENYDDYRAGVLDIPDISEPSELEPQRTQRSRRSTSLPYNLVQQHIQRLHQLHHLHRTREQQISSSNLASRRGLGSSQHLSLRAHQMQAAQAAQMAHIRRNLVNENIFDARNVREDRLDDSHDEIIDFSSFDDLVSSFDNNNNNINNNNNNYSRNNLGVNLLDGVYQRNHNINNNNNNNDNDNNSSRSHHHSSNVALDSVIRRVNLLRQYSQQQESRIMRSSPRHHRSSTGHSSGRSSTSRTTSSQNLHVDRRRDDLIQRGIDVPPSTIRHSSSQLPEPTLLYPNEHNTPSLPPISRLSAWHTRRGVNWSPQSQQRQERRSSFADDFYSTTEVPHPYEDDHHMSRILSPTPTRRYDARFAATLASSLPIGNDHELFGTDNGSNVDRISSSNEPVRTDQRGSASGEVC